MKGWHIMEIQSDFIAKRFTLKTEIYSQPYIPALKLKMVSYWPAKPRVKQVCRIVALRYNIEQLANCECVEVKLLYWFSLS